MGMHPSTPLRIAIIQITSIKNNLYQKIIIYLKIILIAAGNFEDVIFNIEELYEV